MCLIFRLSDKRGSNPRPSAWEANALPTELLSQNGGMDDVLIWQASCLRPPKDLANLAINQQNQSMNSQKLTIINDC